MRAKQNNFDNLDKNILLLVFQYLSIRNFHRAIQVNRHWRNVGRFFDEQHKGFFKRDFPEVFETIQDNNYQVKDWRQEYRDVEEFANSLPNMFIREKRSLKKNWKKNLQSYVPSFMPNAILELVSVKKSLEERKSVWIGIKDMGMVVRVFKTNNPLSPDRPIERLRPKDCARVREELWSLFQEHVILLPQIAILTHQPIEKLQSVIATVNDELLMSACSVSNFEAFGFLCDIRNGHSDSKMSTDLAMDCLNVIFNNKKFEYFAFLVNKLEKDLGIRLPLQSFLCESLESSGVDGNAPTLSLVKFLIEEKACDLNKANEEGVTPLHSACSYQAPNLDVVNYFLEKGVDVNIQTPAGLTPLMLAFESGHWRLIHCLLDKGADLNRVAQPFSLFHVAGCVVNFALSSRRNPLQLVKFLVEEKKMDIAHWDSVFSLFDSAAFVGAGYEVTENIKEIYKYLLDQGANPLLLSFLGRSHVGRPPTPRECRVLELCLEIIANSDLPTIPQVRKFLEFLKSQYQIMVYNRSAYAKTFLLLCAIAIREPLEKIKHLVGQIKNCFEDDARTALLFKLCRKLYPEALVVLPATRYSDDLRQEREIENISDSCKRLRR